jgi:GNAT superfamily N-acetyltransferase
MAIQVEKVCGKDIIPWLEALASLRIEVFRDFPYLYEGSMDYELSYLQTYVNCPQSVVVLVKDGLEVVGASTGLPLRFEEPAFQKPFLDQGFNPSTFFYCAESVLLSRYRGQGLGKTFFKFRENHAKSIQGIGSITFCVVEREADHPLRPLHYRPLDGFWKSIGYQPQPQITAKYSWPDLGAKQATSKTMMFWLKSLHT